MKRLWVQVIDDHGEEVTTAKQICSESLVRIVDLRNAMRPHFPNVLSTVDNFELKMYTRSENGGKDGPLDATSALDGLGQDEENALLVEAPLHKERPRYQYLFRSIGPKLRKPHLVREKLISRIHASLYESDNRFVFLSAPPRSGKLTALFLFEREYPDVDCVGISVANPTTYPIYALERYCGIDLNAKSTTLNDGKKHVVMINQAEQKYSDSQFWKALITEAPTWLPSNIRFIISGRNTAECPIELSSLPTFGPKDFTLSDKEAKELLELPITGLPRRLRHNRLMKLVIRECNGLVGALTSSDSAMYYRFLNEPTPTESELTAYYLSNKFLKHVPDCFGNECTLPTPESKTLQNVLISCLIANGRDCAWTKNTLSEEERRQLVALKDAGILVDGGNGRVQYSSPLAERYHSKLLFPTRAASMPSTLQELVSRAIDDICAAAAHKSTGSAYAESTISCQFVMTAPEIISHQSRSPKRSKIRHQLVISGNVPVAALHQVADAEDDVPVESAFQLRFLQALAASTPYNCAICHEISRVLQLPRELNVEWISL